MMMATRHLTLAFAAALALAGCNVAADSPLPAPEPPQPTCQDKPTCNTCAHQFFPDQAHTDVALDDFDACYEHSHGDHVACAVGNAWGAQEWKHLVSRVCDVCLADCCSFCSDPVWGHLSD